MKYNIGDRVRVKSLAWYNNQKEKDGHVYCNESVFFKSDMSKFCGSILTIKDKDEFSYEVEENNYYWADEMLEGLVYYNENMKNIEITLNDKNYIIDVKKAIELGVVKEKDAGCKSWGEFIEKYDSRTGYYFNSSDKKLTEILNPRSTSEQLTIEEAIAISAFSKLLKLRRDWIGDWNPDWSDGSVRKYYIYFRPNKFYVDYHYDYSRVFSFPTKEMATEFLDCFKDLFEQCKNLI